LPAPYSSLPQHGGAMKVSLLAKFTGVIDIFSVDDYVLLGAYQNVAVMFGWDDVFEEMKKRVREAREREDEKFRF
jgi:hypothetical protein